MHKANDIGRGIYAIVRIGTAELYIGSAVNIAGRWATHRSCLHKGRHHSSRLQRVYDKHGADALEYVVLELVADKADLISREQVWLSRFSPAYNTQTVAKSPLGTKHTAGTIEKMRVSQRKRGPRCATTRARMSAAQAGRKCKPFTAEHRANMSAAQTGRVISAEHRANLSAAGLKDWQRRKAGGELPRPGVTEPPAPAGAVSFWDIYRHEGPQ